MKISDTRKVEYPYLPKLGRISYVPITNKFMTLARDYAKDYSLDRTMPNATVLVKSGNVIGLGANGSDYHDKHGCERVRLNTPTGQSYELCEGCHPKNHSEPKAIADAKSKGYDTQDAEAYLWGHWWCCEFCWKAMLDNGISRVFLLTDSEQLFNKLSNKNIVGKQFA